MASQQPRVTLRGGRSQNARPNYSVQELAVATAVAISDRFKTDAIELFNEINDEFGPKFANTVWYLVHEELVPCS